MPEQHIQWLEMHTTSGLCLGRMQVNGLRGRGCSFDHARGGKVHPPVRELLVLSRVILYTGCTAPRMSRSTNIGREAVNPQHVLFSRSGSRLSLHSPQSEPHCHSASRTVLGTVYRSKMSVARASALA